MQKINKISFSKKSLFNKLSHGLILNFLVRFKGLIYFPILVNYITKEDIGLISLARNLSGILIGLFMLNIPDSSNRIILDFEKRNDSRQIQRVNNSIIFFTLILYIIAGLITLLLIYITNYQSSTFNSVLLLLILAGVLKKLSTFIFQIFQNTKLLMITELIIEYFSFLLVIIMLIFHLYFNALNVLHIYIIVIIFASMVLLGKVNRMYKIKFEIDFSIIKNILKISLFLLPSAYAMIIIQSSDAILIERFLGLKSLGEYSFAYSLAGVVSGLSAAVTFFWYSSVVYADKTQLLKLLNMVKIFSPILLILICTFFYFATKPIINFISSEYLDSEKPILILVSGFFFNVLSSIYFGVLYSLKKERLILVSVLAGAILNVVLNIIFLKDGGIIFAAYSTSIAYFIIYCLSIMFSSIFIRQLLKSSYIFTNILIIVIYVVYLLII